MRLHKFYTVITILSLFSLVSCSPPVQISTGDEDVRIKITSVPLKIVLVAGIATLQVLADDLPDIGIDVADLIDQIVENDNAVTGVPPSDVPVVMVVNKKTNDILYWKLTDKVKTIRLKHDNPGAIELKVQNETPLRVELWMDGDINEIKIDVEMK
jgi:hypothetical protein